MADLASASKPSGTSREQAGAVFLEAGSPFLDVIVLSRDGFDGRGKHGENLWRWHLVDLAVWGNAERLWSRAWSFGQCRQASCLVGHGRGYSRRLVWISESEKTKEFDSDVAGNSRRRTSWTQRQELLIVEIDEAESGYEECEGQHMPWTRLHVQDPERLVARSDGSHIEPQGNVELS